ncbi:MAG: PTS sugar transporter subunit IIA [Candidatus Methylomirabilia bacterium]
MIGVVLATHGELGRALIGAMEMIVGAQPLVAALSLQVADRIEDATTRLQEALEGADEGDGVLVLTDMLGGTPSNLGLSLIGGPRLVEVVSGVSLPMLLKAVQVRRESDLRETAAQVKKVGRAAIIVAGEVLAGPEPAAGSRA